jgi:tryptophan-rich sensory protein
MNPAMARTRRPRDVAVLIGLVALCLAVGWLGGLVTEPSVRTWYPTLVKPAWTPPDALFPIVWTLLYIVMGIAAWLAWRAPAESGRAPAMIAFAAQLVFNFLWSWLFFGLRNPLLGLIDILALLAAIIVTILLFRRRSGWAALLMLPYLLWVGFATALNAAIVVLN